MKVILYIDLDWILCSKSMMISKDDIISDDFKIPIINKIYEQLIYISRKNISNKYVNRVNLRNSIINIEFKSNKITVVDDDDC